MLLTFDFTSQEPLYIQLSNQIVVAISRGELCPGDHLPTIRAVSDESGVNMMTVSKAYQLLQREGYITACRRSGAVVSPRSGVLTAQTRDALRLSVCEMRAAGLSEDEVLSLCREYYREGEK
mgnify:FL=1